MSKKEDEEEKETAVVLDAIVAVLGYREAMQLRGCGGLSGVPPRSSFAKQGGYPCIKPPEKLSAIS